MAIAKARSATEAMTGTLSSGGSTNDTTPTFRGAADAASTCHTLRHRWDDRTRVRKGTLGNWTIAASALSHANHSVTSSATDVASPRLTKRLVGNTSVALTRRAPMAGRSFLGYLGVV